MVEVSRLSYYRITLTWHEQLAKRLNLAEHTAGMQRFSAKRISFPVDIEAHLGEDGRYYLLGTRKQIGTP